MSNEHKEKPEVIDLNTVGQDTEDHPDEFIPPIKLRVEKIPYQDRSVVPIASLFCDLHPVTFASDCMNCNEPCSWLRNVIGHPQVADAIPIHLRRKLIKTLYGKESPFIDIAEQTGITLRPEVVKGNAVLRPAKIDYLKVVEEKDAKLTARQPTREELRRHWRNYYRGYACYRALGLIQSVAKMMIFGVPAQVSDYIDYYRYHFDIMHDKVNQEIDIDSLTEKLNIQGSSDKNIDDQFNAFVTAGIHALLKSKNMDEAELLSKILDTAKKVISRDTQTDAEKEDPANNQEKEELK